MDSLCTYTIGHSILLLLLLFLLLLPCGCLKDWICPICLQRLSADDTPGGGGGGGGGTLIFSYIRRFGSFFWVKNFEFQYILGFSEELIFFGV